MNGKVNDYDVVGDMLGTTQHMRMSSGSVEDSSLSPEDLSVSLSPTKELQVTRLMIPMDVPYVPEPSDLGSFNVKHVFRHWAIGKKGDNSNPWSPSLDNVFVEALGRMKETIKGLSVDISADKIEVLFFNLQDMSRNKALCGEFNV